ncbi:TPA: DUF1427 family protein [Burkholderia cenocepacia]
MEPYLVSLGAGVLIGVIYSAIKVRSPAPPLIALVGLIGMLTDRDIVVRAVSMGVPPNESIEGVVSGPANWCYEDDDISAVQKKMEDAQIRRVPVVDRQKRLVGIVALGDLATAADGAMSSTLGAVSAPSRPDR